MKNLMRDNLFMARRFSNTVRYSDDLLTLNNSHAEVEINNIYPHNALFSKYGVSVRTHVHEGICIHWWLSMSYLNIFYK